MWLGVILICTNPLDVRSCDIAARVDKLFPTEIDCRVQIRADVQYLTDTSTAVVRGKCFKVLKNA